MNRLIEALQSGRVVLMDGAMGTELQRLGLPDGEPPELWNLTHPERVASVHAAYLEAGADVLLTNTFQANGAALAKHGLHERIADIWQAAVDMARIARQPAPIVLAAIGPCTPLTPVVRTTLLKLGLGTDGHLFETWSADRIDIDAVLPCNFIEFKPQFPLFVSFAYRKSANPDQLRSSAMAVAKGVASRLLFGKPIAAIGANCGVEIDMDDLLDVVHVYRDESDLPIFIRPNAGTPRKTDAGWDYPRTPEYMADKLWPLLEAGVTMVGGCCGTTPAHIAAFRQVVDQWNGRRNV
jgi:methionine synthase I (cobalamin-dependent)